MATVEYRRITTCNIPQKLKDLNQWTCWQSQSRDKGAKPGKVPFYKVSDANKFEDNCKHASLSKPETWMSFDDATNLLEKFNKKLSGVQFVLPKLKNEDDDRIIVIDLDHAINNRGDIKNEVVKIIKKFNSYTELSPTVGINGGVHIFCKGKFPRDTPHKVGDFEIYQEDKLITLTGDISLLYENAKSLTVSVLH